MSREELFWAKVDRREADQCWEWSAYRNRQGYGRFNIGGNTIRAAHRVAYELIVGPIPAGMELDHLCRNRACCNPAHLEPVAHVENVRRGEAGLHLAVKQRAKTTCPQGHPYAGRNLIYDNRGRRCRECRAETSRSIRAARRAERSIA